MGRPIAAMTAFLWLVSHQAGAQQNGDQCHVYFAEQGEGISQTIMDLITTERDPKELERKIGEYIKILGQFETKVAEEEETSRSYAIPGRSNLFVTASVFYTDESMAGAGVGPDSMLLSIAVANKELETARGALEGAQAEVSTGRFAGGVRVKKTIKLDGKEYLIGLECQRKPSQPDQR